MHKPITETEKLIVADMLASIGRVIIGRTNDRTIELLDRLVMLLELPAPHRWNKFRTVWSPPRQSPRLSERLTEDEVNIIAAWLDSVTQVFDGRSCHAAKDVAAKIQQELYRIHTVPSKKHLHLIE